VRGVLYQKTKFEMAPDNPAIDKDIPF